MRAMAQDRVADVVKMRHLRFVEQDAVLKFARVPHHHAIARDDVLADVTTAADMAILADPGRALQDRALFDDRSRADENRVADERFSNQFAQHRRFQPKLEIARDLAQRVPDIFLGFKQLRVRRVFETEEFRRRKHESYAPARRVIFCPSLLSRACQPRAASSSRNSSLFLHSFASLACTRASASFAISAGNAISSPVTAST